jgi:hypothetical protein
MSNVKWTAKRDHSGGLLSWNLSRSMPFLSRRQGLRLLL